METKYLHDPGAWFPDVQPIFIKFIVKHMKLLFRVD